MRSLVNCSGLYSYSVPRLVPPVGRVIRPEAGQLSPGHRVKAQSSISRHPRYEPVPTRYFQAMVVLFAG